MILVDNNYECLYTNIANGEVNSEISDKFRGYSFFDFKGSLGIYIKRKQINERILGLYDFETNRELWEIKYREINASILSESLFLQWSIEGWIEMLSIQTGQLLWQYSVEVLGNLKDINEPNRVSRILGLINSVLVVQVSLGANDQNLIGLDAHTGKLLWLLDEFDYQGVHYPYLSIDIYRFHPNAEHTRLLSINKYFTEINPLTGEVIKYNPIMPLDKNGKFSEYNGVGIIPFDGKAEGKYIYFNALVEEEDGRTALFPASIGVFNMETEQIEWLHVFREFWEGAGNALVANTPPVSDGNRLYALDLQGTLHIFERVEEKNYS